MKKVISLALAMVMALSMTAMAANIGLGPVEGEDDAVANSGQTMFPGETYQYDTRVGAATTSNHRMKLDWEKGAAMVDSAKMKVIDGTIHIVVELKENYTIDEPKALVGTYSIITKDTKATAGTGVFGGTVSNNVEDIDGGDNRDDATAIEVENNTIYNMTSSGWVDFGGDGERLSSVLVRLPEDKQVFAYWNEDAIEEVEDKYYDLDADIEYVNFVAKPNLGRNAEIAIQGDYSDQYHLYEYVGGELEPIDADWNEDDGLFEFTASKLGSYVISDKELVAEADEPAEDDEPAADDTTTQNPDTGANDVVGVAVALAAVSLVAAGAVSLKK